MPARAERAVSTRLRSGSPTPRKPAASTRAELQDLETKRSKYKSQLMDVKTNKEYTAMLHEIEGVERDIRAREDQILAEMERAEGLAAEVKAEEAEFKRWRPVTATIARPSRDADGDLEGRRRPPHGGTRRHRRHRRRGGAGALSARGPTPAGVAVAEARDGMCLSAT